MPGFARDQPGRRSMSEKRHATLDAKSTDTYQRSKKARAEREQAAAENSGEVGPTLGMKKSSSLESLQTMMLEMKMETGRPPATRVKGSRVVRGRGCNESFRAAVDRSYEAQEEDQPGEFRKLRKKSLVGSRALSYLQIKRSSPPLTEPSIANQEAVLTPIMTRRRKRTTKCSRALECSSKQL